MNKFLGNIFLLFAFVSGLQTYGQTTTSSTYSQFGLGALSGPYLPQNRAMGGISAGLRKPGGYDNINLANPASYSSVQLTTFEAGLSSEYLNRTKGGISESDFTSSLSHLAFAIPVSRKSALSFGILPYSSLGYSAKRQSSLNVQDIDHVYSGDGGLSKAYLGYGFQLGKHLSLGGNFAYTFGKLERSTSLEFPNDTYAYSVREQTNTSVGGISFDYGVQYSANLSPKVALTLGYAGTAASNLSLDVNSVLTRYFKASEGAEDLATDTVSSTEKKTSTLKLPAMHTMGFTLQNVNKWLFGADFKLGQWDNYREANKKPSYIRNAYGFAVGGQITPDINSVGSYLKVVDYRLGFSYDKSYININNTDIKQMAVTLGFGFPLQASPTRTTFYKINFAAELGQRGTLSNSLVRERYVNFHLGFTLNDQWFRKYKFD